jgi:uncharacterized protein (TIGR01777 family)
MEETPRKLLVSGGSGLIGSALCAFWTERGHAVHRLVRREPRGSNELAWDPRRGLDDAQALAGYDAVVHLAGENVGSGPWTPSKKARIRESRVQGTRVLAAALARCESPPGVLLCASATGFYGDRADDILDETSAPGRGFLADVCREWETATEAAQAAGNRVVHLRIGVVLASRGGVLAKMAPVFRLGLGGPFADGTQYLPWIALEDIVRAFHHTWITPSLTGAVNAVAPNPSTNREFTRTLGKVLGRPARLRVPAFALRALPGGMGEEMLLASQRVVPAVLTASGFVFRHPELEPALQDVLER